MAAQATWILDETCVLDDKHILDDTCVVGAGSPSFRSISQSSLSTYAKARNDVSHQLKDLKSYIVHATVFTAAAFGFTNITCSSLLPEMGRQIFSLQMTELKQFMRDAPPSSITTMYRIFLPCRFRPLWCHEVVYHDCLVFAASPPKQQHNTQCLVQFRTEIFSCWVELVTSQCTQ